MNTIHLFLDHPLLQRLGWALFHSIWQAAVVAAVLAVVLGLMRRASANARYLVACAGLLIIAVMPIITLFVVDVSSPVVFVAPPEMTPMAAVPEAAPYPGPLPAAPDVAVALPAPFEVEVPSSEPWWPAVLDAVEGALPYLVVIWLFGVFSLSLWHLGGWAQLRRLKRRMISPVTDQIASLTRQLADAFDIRRAVRVVQSALVEVPTLVGWVKPVILLPASALSGLTPDQLDAILAHELAHVRRHDYLVNLLQTVIEILGFYHPAVWWISRRIRVERENCCDDLAAAHAGNPQLYVRALATMEELRGPHGIALAASGARLVDRIRRLAGREDDTRPRISWLPALLAVVAICLIPLVGASNAKDSGAEGGGQSGAGSAARERSSPETQAETNGVLVPKDVFKAEPLLTRENTRRLPADQSPPAKPGAQIKLDFVIAVADAASEEADVLSTPSILARDGTETRLEVGVPFTTWLGEEEALTAQQGWTGVVIAATPHLVGEEVFVKGSVELRETPERDELAAGSGAVAVQEVTATQFSVKGRAWGESVETQPIPIGGGRTLRLTITAAKVGPDGEHTRRPLEPAETTEEAATLYTVEFVLLEAEAAREVFPVDKMLEAPVELADGDILSRLLSYDASKVLLRQTAALHVGETHRAEDLETVTERDAQGNATGTNRWEVGTRVNIELHDVDGLGADLAIKSELSKVVDWMEDGGRRLPVMAARNVQTRIIIPLDRWFILLSGTTGTDAAGLHKDSVGLLRVTPGPGQADTKVKESA